MTRDSSFLGSPDGKGINNFEIVDTAAPGAARKGQRQEGKLLLISGHRDLLTHSWAPAKKKMNGLADGETRHPPKL